MSCITDQMLTLLLSVQAEGYRIYTDANKIVCYDNFHGGVAKEGVLDVTKEFRESTTLDEVLAKVEALSIDYYCQDCGSYSDIPLQDDPTQDDLHANQLCESCLEDLLDDLSLERDPYAHYGVSRADFRKLP
ncbi:MAG: hypothetical protein L3J47_00135 [Sulfurovum sp.]|nr:hypothetical protein [Sulfurovum sp.]